MTNKEAAIWLLNLSDDIGKAEHQSLWHYEQALQEMREMLECEPERKKGKWIYGEDNPGTGRDGWFCSECEHFEMWDYSADMKSAELNLPNFCPNCGARMTEEEA